MTTRSFEEVKNYLKKNYMWVAVESAFKLFKSKTEYPGTLYDLYREEGGMMARDLGLYTLCRKEVWAEYVAAYEEFCGLNEGPRYRVATRRKLVCVVEGVSEEDSKVLIKLAQKIDRTAFYSQQIAGTNNYRVYGIEKYLEKI